MDPGEQTTGTGDEHYNLISVLYHALHGAENCEMYMADAEAARNEHLAAFFREAQIMQTDLAERAKELLGIGGLAPGGVGAVPPEGVVEPGGIPSQSVDVPPDTPGGVPSEPPRGQDLPGTAPLETEAPPEPPPPDFPSDAPREAPPPGEERPERRGMAPSTDTPREAPPPGEERPERRTP